MRRRPLALGAALLAAASACSTGHHPPAAAPPAAATATSTATTAGAPDPYAVPPTITPAYVDKVFAALNHVDGEASRELLIHHQLTPRFRALVRAIYNDPLYSVELGIASESLGGAIPRLRLPLGDVQTTVVRIVASSPRCVFVETTSDFAAVLVDPGPPARSEYFRLSPTQASANPNALNPTPWSMSFNASYRTPTSIPNQCAA